MWAYSCPRCSNFFLEELALVYINSRWAAKRHLLTIAVRAASDAGQIPELDDVQIVRFIESAPQNRTLFEGVDRFLLLLAGRTSRFRESVTFDKSVDYPLLYVKDEQEMNELVVTAAELGFFDIRDCKITLNGWRRIDDLRASQPNSRQAFVAMWFADELTDAWVNGFKKGIEDTNYYSPLRVDSVQHNEKIDDRIIAEIRRSGLVVADFTGDRGGVYFEAGFALGLGIPVIWTCRGDWVEKLHFDTRQYNHIVWKEPGDLSIQLRDRILATGVSRSRLGAC